MKKISILGMLLFLVTVHAQVDRSIGPSQYRNSKSSYKPEKKDPVEVSLAFLKKELNLDSFQEAATKVYLTENLAENEKIIALSIPSEQKKEKFDEAIKTFDEKMIKILNPDQIKLFEVLKDKNKSKEKSKNKKKKKKEEED